MATQQMIDGKAGAAPRPRVTQRAALGASRGAKRKPRPFVGQQQPKRGTRGTPSPPSSPPRVTPSAPVDRVTAPPSPPSIRQFLGADEVYQQALRGGTRGLEDFLSDIERRRGESGVAFGQTQGRLEEDRTRQLERMRDEFASRGLIHSGLFGKEQGRFQEAFQQQMQQLEQQQAGLLADFLSQETDYRRELEQSKEIARQEALARRAARFGIPM